MEERFAYSNRSVLLYRHSVINDRSLTYIVFRSYKCYNNDITFYDLIFVLSREKIYLVQWFDSQNRET